MKLEDKLKLYVEAGIPVLLKGMPGIGKTERVKALARREGWHLEVLPLNVMEPPDVGGIPVAAGDRAIFLPPEWAKRAVEAAKQGKRPVIFLDELNTAPPAVQNTALKLVHERRAGTVELPENTAFIAAVNPPEATTGAWDIVAPLANRFAHVRVEPDVGEWTEWARVQGPHHARLAAFIKHKPSYLHRQPKDAAGAAEAWPSPRSWDRVARLMGAVKGLDQLYELAVEQVGEAAAAELIAWLKVAELVDPEAALRDPSGFKVPEREDAAFSLVYEAAAILERKPGKEVWKSYWRLLVRLLEAGYKDIAATGASFALDTFRRIGKGWPIPQEITRFSDYLQETLLKVRGQ